MCYLVIYSFFFVIVIRGRILDYWVLKNVRPKCACLMRVVDIYDIELFYNLLILILLLLLELWND
jgi:hypothetical protein